VLVARSPRTRALAPFVETLWVFGGRAAHDFERLLPNGRMQLLVNLFEDALRDYAPDGTPRDTTKGAAVQGPRARPAIIGTAEQRAICGVSFAPGGAHPFFSTPASELSERLVDLSALWGRDGAVLRERVLAAGDPEAQLDALEAALVERASRGLTTDGGFELARRMLAEGAPVEAVVHRLGVSPGVFIERFRARTGLTPKLFARVERFQRLVHALGGVASWADLALSHGYADQAHMIREFKAFSGTTPTGYLARSHETRNHALLEIPKNSSIHGV
jgi:AraC-like DNA-binding protein